MQIKVFSLPVSGSEQVEEEVNRFLRGHRVMTVDRQFCAEGGGYWTLFITYQAGNTAETMPARGAKVDYREVLSTEEFGRFARYKDIRKELATKNGIPAYAVFTDDELAQMAKMEEITIASISSIKGVSKRAEKYGEAFLSNKNAGEQ